MIPVVSQLSSIGHGCALVLTEKSFAARSQARSWGLEHWVEIFEAMGSPAGFGHGLGR